MANTPKNMNLVKQILQLHATGIPKKEIARQLSISKNTVKSYLAKATACAESPEELVRLDTPILLSKLLAHSGSNRERFQEFLSHAECYHKELLTHKRLTKYLLWKEEVEKGRTQYRYSQFCEHLREFEKSQATSSVITHLPGEKTFLDFTGDKLYLTDCHSGKLTPCEVLVVTLGYSNFTWVVAAPSQQVDPLVEATVTAFHAIGGATKALVPDNLKSAVTKSDRFEPIINPRFLDMANYYGMAVLPTRAKKPKDKAKVEGAVNHVYQAIFARIRHQSFSDIDKLNAALSALCNQFNETTMKGYGKSRRELLEQEERAHLSALPDDKYRKVEEYKLKVQSNNHIFLGKRTKYYSVPYRLIGQQVTVLASGKLVKIYHKGECVATHTTGHGRYQTNEDHMGSAHKAYLASINPDVLKNKASAIDKDVLQVISQILDRSNHPETNYKTCQGILFLHKKFGASKLIESCRIALQAGIINYRYICSICENPYSGTEVPEDKGALPVHDNIRGNYQ